MRESAVVLIIADDAAFARDLLGRWQLERTVPGFTIMSTELFHGAAAGNFDIAIVGPVRHGRLATVLKSMDTASHPIICILQSSAQVHTAKGEHARLMVLQQHEGWLESVLLLATECLKRVELSDRLRRTEQAASANARHAALGRYMLDTRHDFNNLLTSVLGNAELLLLDSGNMAEVPRDQVETIHSMALHMHEIMQRFSSMATEIQVAEKQSQDETPKLSHMTVSTS